MRDETRNSMSSSVFKRGFFAVEEKFILSNNNNKTVAFPPALGNFTR
jgi:hypothetical protein